MLIQSRTTVSDLIRSRTTVSDLIRTSRLTAEKQHGHAANTGAEVTQLCLHHLIRPGRDHQNVVYLRIPHPDKVPIFFFLASQFGTSDPNYWYTGVLRPQHRSFLHTRHAHHAHHTCHAHRSLFTNTCFTPSPVSRKETS
jgi:hypothetical protein